MFMEVKPGYVNPLTMSDPNSLGAKVNRLSGRNSGGKGQVEELQIKRQQMENELLLLKTTGTGGDGTSAKKVKQMEEKLSRVNEDLRSAKTKGGTGTEKGTKGASVEEEQSLSQIHGYMEEKVRPDGKPKSDVYEKEEKSPGFVGIYGRDGKILR